MKLKTKFNTAISFWRKSNTYEAGRGSVVSWDLYREGAMTIFPCEWRQKLSGGNGNATYEANAEGVIDRVSVRMPYIPELYDILRVCSVVCVKGTDPAAVVDGEPNPDNPNCYEVFGGVDNMREENQYMEFAVKRYEVNG